MGDKAPIVRQPKTSIGNTVLTVGHVVDYKNPVLWLEVAEKVISAFGGRVKFVWVGGGSMLEEMRRIVLEHGLGDNVKFVGHLEEIERFYKNATVYFQPSLIESQGISVIEAMSFGLPCVVSNVGGIPEIISDGFNGFVCNADDIDGFANSITKLIKDQALSETMGRRNLLMVQEKFNREAQYEKLLDLHRKAVKKHALAL